MLSLCQIIYNPSRLIISTCDSASIQLVPQKYNRLVKHDLVRNMRVEATSEHP